MGARSLKSGRLRWGGRHLFAWSLLQPFVALAAVVLVFVVCQFALHLERPFLTPKQIATMANQTVIPAMGALGMTVIIASAGIDLSAGSLVALAAVALAYALRAGMPAPWAVLVMLAVGLAAGAVNGLLITRLRLVPFIATLGTMGVFRGLAEQLTDAQKISIEAAPGWLADLSNPNPPGSLASGTWLIVALAVVLSAILRRTVFGRHVLAIGSNEAAATLSGIRVPRVKVAVYALGGLFMALAGLFSFSYLNMQGDPETAIGYELDVIAAVVIGGGSLNGGRANVLGSIVGALTMTVLRAGCIYASVSEPITKIVIGAIVVAAVAVDQLSQRRGRRA